MKQKEFNIILNVELGKNTQAEAYSRWARRLTQFFIDVKRELCDECSNIDCVWRGIENLLTVSDLNECPGFSKLESDE